MRRERRDGEYGSGEGVGGRGQRGGGSGVVRGQTLGGLW